MMSCRFFYCLCISMLFMGACTNKSKTQRRNEPSGMQPIEGNSNTQTPGENPVESDSDSDSDSVPNPTSPKGNDPRLACLGSSLQIVGGKEVEASDDVVLPSTVAITDANGPFCTGTLVGPNQVITAAHCFYEGETADTLMSPEKIKSLRIGIGPRGTPIAGVRVVAGVPHELFDFAKDSNDVGVLIIEGDLPMNARPVRIADYDAAATIASVIKAGYGATSDADQTPGLLRKVEVPVMKFYPELKEFDLINGQKIGTCYGDSGGPAYIPSTKVPGCLEVIGATSRGARDPRIQDCDSGNGIDTDVRLYKDWAGCYFMKNGKPLPYLKGADLKCSP